MSASFVDQYVTALQRALNPQPDATPEPPEFALQRELQRCPAPQIGRDQPDLDGARVIIRDALHSYLTRETIGMDAYPMQLLRTAPGTGKSTAAAAAINKITAAGLRVVFFAPQHSFFIDMLDAVEETGGNPGDWYEWQPRSADNCRHCPEMNAWLRKGYDAVPFCSGVCGWEYMTGSCPYHAQKQVQHRVIFAMHMHAAIGHPLADSFAFAFGDEMPLNAFLNPWAIPAAAISPPGVSGKLQQLLDRVTALAVQSKKWLGGGELIDALGGSETVEEACAGFAMPLDALAAADVHGLSEAETAPYFHLPTFIPLLLREARLHAAGRQYPQRVRVGNKALTLLLRHSADARAIKSSLVWMDGTGDSRIYERLFNRPVEIVEASPKLRGRVFQVVDRANGKGALVDTSGEAPVPTRKAEQALDFIIRLIRDRDYQRPGVITFQTVERAHYLQMHRSAHFYGNRGSNQFTDQKNPDGTTSPGCDALFILGTPQPALDSIETTAAMLFFERDEPFDATWRTDWRPFPQYVAPDGYGRAYPVGGFWGDPDLQALVEIYREHELFQSASRGRPVVRDTVDTWLLTNIPIAGLPPDEIVTMGSIIGAPEGVNIWEWARFVDLCREIIETPGGGDAITASLIVEQMGISRDTAIKYIRLLIEKHPDEFRKPEPGEIVAKRGRPGVAAVGIRRE